MNDVLNEQLAKNKGSSVVHRALGSAQEELSEDSRISLRESMFFRGAKDDTLFCADA